jgi:hypothetical protein
MSQIEAAVAMIRQQTAKTLASRARYERAKKEQEAAFMELQGDERLLCAAKDHLLEVAERTNQPLAQTA